MSAVTNFRAMLVALALALALAGAATAAASTKVIGHGVRLKGTRVFYAHGNAAAPKTVFATVLPTPKQPVKVQWSVVCQKPNKADPAVQIGASVKIGETTVQAAATVKLALPFAKPPNCVATVYATLARDGGLVLRLLQT